MSNGMRHLKGVIVEFLHFLPCRQAGVQKDKSLFLR
jgi:hypothetical protein